MNTMRSFASVSLFGALFSNSIIIPAEVAGQPTCSEERQCSISNDPHFTTWDSNYYDNHGTGTMMYVKSCLASNDFDIITGVPFQVSAKQGPCSSYGSTPTCLEEIYITVEDGTTITYINDDPLLPLIPPSPPAGSFSTANTNYVTSDNLFEGDFIDSNGETAHFKVQIDQHVIVITASECILDATNGVCGLCGTPDNDPSNDFTVSNPETGEQDVLKEQNVENAHAFGDAWCEAGDCLTGTDVDTLFEASEECLEMATVCCEMIWDLKCMDYCADMADTTLNYDIWMQDCAFDGCAMTENRLENIGCQEAIEEGFFDSPIQRCQKLCQWAMQENFDSRN